MKIPTPVKKVPKAPHPLIGLYFLSFKADGACHWQGQIKEVLKDDVLLVQLFSWLTGDPTNMALIPIAETLSDGDSKDLNKACWKLYHDHDQFVEAGNRSLDVAKG